MKILRITVNNIASLAGTQTIDFTREPLRSAGLFGISGATGSGKSSLLDAMCLALFDATPRLKRIGKLEQTIDGENQKSPATLLRRGTTSGFAEVAFVGLDLRIWTARWSVRRSRNKVDGKLQPAEMTLFRGNVMPGKDGPVTAGGKKTLVQRAIVDRIGLTFDQFTRAVLLAQNEFATFLKAADGERAEILQALTGTEVFERLSRAVFARCSSEKQELERLRASLAGTTPMIPEERSEAETKYRAAGDRVQQIEATRRILESHATWFKLQKNREQELNQAREQLRMAKTNRKGAARRRHELEQTEFSVREAAVHWRSREDTSVRHTEAEDAVGRAARLAATKSELQKQSADRLTTAQENVRAATSRQSALAPLILSARQLDARLEPLEERVARTQRAMDNSQTAYEAAVSEFSVAAARRNELLKSRKQLNHAQERLVTFAPFVGDSAKWLHLLHEAQSAESEAAEAGNGLEELKQRRAEQARMLKTAQGTVTKAEQSWKTARHELQEAESAEQKFNVDGMSSRRHEIDNDCSLLTTLIQELDRQNQQRQQAKILRDELAALEELQKAESATLQTLTDRLVPDAERDVALATSQLRFIEAAVDDHTQRLRAALQVNQPCPVCGSPEHPWQHQTPEVEIAGVKAAQSHVEHLQKICDSLKEDQQRQFLSVQSRSERISQQRKRDSLLTAQVEEFVLSNVDSPMVITVLTRPAKHRLDSAQEQLGAAVKRRAQLDLEEQDQRQAVENTRCRRRQEEDLRQQFESRQCQLADRERKLTATDVQSAAAEGIFRTTSERRKNAIVALGDLWCGLAGAKEHFETNPATFCETFESSMEACRRITDELATLVQAIEYQDARIDPLEKAVHRAGRALASCEANSRAAIEARAELLRQRQLLLDGRAADDVEAEMKAEMKAADESVEQHTEICHQAEIECRSADQRLESARGRLTQATAALQTAKEQLSSWLNRFRLRFSKQLTVDELRVMLDRDEEWMQHERLGLKRLDDNVTTAEGALTVLTEQLREHVERRPTADDESVVQAALEKLAGELKEATTDATDAGAVLASDDQRRRQTTDLFEQLRTQENVADPWLKLNDLIGSKEGDKFRMIAQRRTLDLLLRYANYQLHQLARRYRLQRLPESLNLIVIDEQMGDEQRSVHSLSGGESFLVSLALALGLASLTSSRMKIESLFIDEGFGSLDSETLSTAMNALMHLEAQGRRVGVISHVTEMTDAVPVQIHVVKRRGGASKLVIPGTDAEFEPATLSEEPGQEPGDPQTPNVDSIAEFILKILNRERQVGRYKVSNRALRMELGCGAREFKAAQKLLDGRVRVDGRSLRLG